MLSRYAQRIFQKRFESTAEAVKNLTSKNVGSESTSKRKSTKFDNKLDRIGSDLHKAFETLGYLRASFDKSKK
ncbi:unnamed protein product [Rhizophagus irregularis]|nr:unnamed protein product [Rhizophagus irregularis]CAB5181568.1 unnamed protein product [Rhizophagus irregularis]